MPIDGSTHRTWRLVRSVEHGDGWYSLAFEDEYYPGAAVQGRKYAATFTTYLSREARARLEPGVIVELNLTPKRANA